MSYYKTIDGIKYDGELLELADKLIVEMSFGVDQLLKLFILRVIYLMMKSDLLKPIWP